ncbi:hypothetical protein IPZ58_23355 [Streptomyces roseoverticillatus]|uniref:hypothetical protein n=1 Tax=Streptomyces roseoverticillatus TaxID=66429 RepID=UPI001F2D48D4|nr:hypothetical protein [Streptomyces roseoverticillatus]MCF3104508.1 hypothetical protein [Streptomyces roseoverticillatus]
MSSPTAHTLTGTQATTAYHYIITIQTSNGAMRTQDGLLHRGPGATRAECLRGVVEPLYAEFGRPAVILFFSLEPNTLASEAGE